MIDLQQLMDERSAGAPDLTGMRILSVRRRIVRRRRAMVSAVAAVAAVIAVIAGLAFSPGHRSAPHPAATPRPSPSTFGTFQEYARGAHVVASGQGWVADGTLTVLWTPTLLDAKTTIFASCDFTGPDSTQLWLTAAVNGHPLMAGSCGRHGGAESSRTHLDPEEYELAVGRPAVVTLVAEKAQEYKDSGIVDVAMPPDGQIALAVGEAVDFADYPLPPRPSVLPSLALAQDVADGSQVRISSDPADPLRPSSRRVAWTGGFNVQAVSTTPGYLLISVDGVEITQCQAWDYSGESCNTMWRVADKKGFEFVDRLRSRIGKTVTITVTPTHVTGPWQVGIVQSN